jgi:hypothetical protein
MTMPHARGDTLTGKELLGSPLEFPTLQTRGKMVKNLACDGVNTLRSATNTVLDGAEGKTVSSIKRIHP